MKTHLTLLTLMVSSVSALAADVARTWTPKCDWVNLSSPLPQIIGGQWRVTLPVTNGPSTFYRLVK